MKTLLFLLISFSLSAQLTTVPKVIFKATNNDSVNIGFVPSGTCLLTVKNNNEVIDDNAQISGYHVLNLVIDSATSVTASATGSISYTIYKNGVNVTPTPVADNNLADILIWYNGLTAAQKNKVIVALIYLNKEGLRSIKALMK